ncbi:hypothetical protein DRJ17_02895 [Candidatus Woesearchaeota archaeon]|nr:MAG: hypothetical protein DRJ17_02895 [Candidatus Woesearchaeota archaeon]
MKHRKAQAAMDYLLTVGFAMLIIVSAFGLFISVSQRSQKQISQERINIVGRAIQENANLVYFQGEDSRITIDADLPDNLMDISVFCYNNNGSLGDVKTCINSEIVFTFNDLSERVFLLKNVPMDELISSDFLAGSKKLQVLVTKSGDRDFVLLTDMPGVGYSYEQCSTAEGSYCDVMENVMPGFKSSCCNSYGFCCG